MTERLVPLGDAEAKARPIQSNGVGDGAVVCRACRAPNAAGDNRCVRCQAWLPMNQAAVQAGLYRAQQPIELLAEAEAIVIGIIADKGGQDELSTLQREYVRELGRLTIMLRLLVAEIAEHGLLSPSRAPRRVFDAYLAGLDRFDRLAQRIGTKREARQLRTNLTEFVRGQR